MELHSSEATAGLYIPMASPAFPATQIYCFLFHYKVWISEFTKEPERLPELEIYISETSHVFSGRKVWGSDGTGEGLVQFPIQAKPGANYRISFVGLAYKPSTSLIQVASVKLNPGNCSSSCSGIECSDRMYDIGTKCELFCQKF